MKKKQVLVLSLFVAGMLMICGCGQTAQKPVPDTNQGTGVQQTTDAEKRTMASRLSTIATEVEGVQKATVVVVSQPDANGVAVDPFSGLPNDGTGVNTPGQTANPPGQTANPEQGNLVVMVGITLNQADMQNQDKVNNIKEQVKNKIKTDSDKVREVLVTTDPNLIMKLQDVAAGIIQGQPVESYTQNINELDKSLRSQQ